MGKLIALVVLALFLPSLLGIMAARERQEQAKVSLIEGQAHREEAEAGKARAEATSMLVESYARATEVSRLSAAAATKTVAEARLTLAQARKVESGIGWDAISWPVYWTFLGIVIVAWFEFLRRRGFFRFLGGAVVYAVGAVVYFGRRGRPERSSAHPNGREREQLPVRIRQNVLLAVLLAGGVLAVLTARPTLVEAAPGEAPKPPKAAPTATANPRKCGYVQAEGGLMYSAEVVGEAPGLYLVVGDPYGQLKAVGLPEPGWYPVGKFTATANCRTDVPNIVPSEAVGLGSVPPAGQAQIVITPVIPQVLQSSFLFLGQWRPEGSKEGSLVPVLEKDEAGDRYRIRTPSGVFWVPESEIVPPATVVPGASGENQLTAVAEKASAVPVWMWVGLAVLLASLAATAFLLGNRDRFLPERAGEEQQVEAEVPAERPRLTEAVRQPAPVVATAEETEFERNLGMMVTWFGVVEDPSHEAFLEQAGAIGIPEEDRETIWEILREEAARREADAVEARRVSQQEINDRQRAAEEATFIGRQEPMDPAKARRAFGLSDEDLPKRRDDRDRDRGRR